MVNLSDFKVSHFPDGHKHIKSDKDLKDDDVLEASIRTFDDLFLVAQVRQIHPELTRLQINYLLAGRCDRRFSPGEACDLKIVCDYINSMGWEYIYVVKPHSNKTLQYLQKNTSQIDYTARLLDMCRKDLGGTICYVCPDKGASHWIDDIRPQLSPLIQGSKKRDENGVVIGVQFLRSTLFQEQQIDSLNEKIHYENFVIVDDLCDGGATFIAIAREIKLRSPNAMIYLVVTHAIFSKGFQPFEGLIDRIYCTNSFADWENPLVKQIQL